MAGKSFVLLLTVALMASSVAAQEGHPQDPWEGFNRRVFAMNQRLDRHVLKPVAEGYVRVVPSPIRRGVANFFDNIGYPSVVVNQFLQGKPKRGLADVGRFLVNSTLGIGGLLDPASRVGLRSHTEDFGQTFGAWGIPQGPYLVVPLMGSSSVRGAAGSAVGGYLWPVRFLDDDEWRYGLSALSIIDTRAGLLEVEGLVSGDRYLFFRDVYLQRRDYLINDGRIQEDPFLDGDF